MDAMQSPSPLHVQLRGGGRQPWRIRPPPGGSRGAESGSPAPSERCLTSGGKDVAGMAAWCGDPCPLDGDPRPEAAEARPLAEMAASRGLLPDESDVEELLHLMQVLHCTVLYCTLRYCTVRHRAALHYTALYCTITVVHFCRPADSVGASNDFCLQDSLHCTITALHCTITALFYNCSALS